MQPLRPGDRGSAVAEVRRMLASIGLLRNVEGGVADVFDEDTELAVRHFQQRRGMVVSGTVAEAPSGTPLTGAQVEYFPQQTDNPDLRPDVASLWHSAVESGPGGAFRIVLVRGRRPEDCDDGVADELLHRAPVALELVPEPRVVRGQQRPDVLGVEPLSALGRADQVREDDGDELALLAWRGGGRCELCAALGAELRRLGVLGAADGAGAHRTILRRRAPTRAVFPHTRGSVPRDMREGARADTVRAGAGSVPLRIERG